jgi:opacity protein-like surface antigen
MKRFTAGAVLAAALLAGSAGSAAAEGLQLGARAGYNYNIFQLGVDGEAGTTAFTADPGMGGGIGLSLRQNIVPDLVNVVVEPSFYYRSMGSWDYTGREYRLGVDVTDPLHPIPNSWVWYSVTQTWSITEMVIDIPILIQYTYEDRYYVQLGVDVGIPFGTKATINDVVRPVNGSGKKEESEKTIALDQVEKDYNASIKRNPVDVGLVIGLGYMLTSNFGVDIRYCYSFVQPIEYKVLLKDKDGKVIYDIPLKSASMSGGLGLSVYF